MELITYRITLDTNRNGVQRTLQGFETGDNLSRELRISLTDGKESYEIPLDNSVSAVMYVTTPSGVLCVNDCDIDGNEIVYKVLDTDTLEAGIVQMQIKLVSSSKVLVSPRFAMDVWESTVDDSEALESPTFTALETALAEAQEAYNGRVTSVVLDDDNLFVVTYADGREYTSTAIQDALELIDSVEEYVEEAKESAETATDAKDVVEADKAIVESAKDVVVSAQASVTASKASVDASEANALSYKNDAYDYMESAHTYATEAMEAEGYAQTAESAKNDAVSAKDVAVASANTCTTASASASANKILAQSYAVGGTGTRAGEDTDNAKYYMEQASHIAQVDIATPSSVGISKPDDSSIGITADGTLSVKDYASKTYVDSAVASATPSDYATVKSQVQTNVTNIATNTADISTNASNISANTTAIGGKGDTLTYDEDNSLLYLKSGSTVLSSVHIEGGSVASIIHVDTHETDWKGNQNVLVEIFDDTHDYQGHFDANGDYFHKVNTIGEHIVKVTDEDGTEWESSVNVTTIGGVYYVYVDRASYSYTGWLTSANITDTFGSLASVLADQVTVRKLMTIHASADYLCEWVAENDSVRATIFASEYAMKWIGLRDYVCDKLMADYKDEMLESDEWEYILKDKVPVMTSDSAPYGTVIYDSYYANVFYGWYAFDRTKSDVNDRWVANEKRANAYIGYKFTNPILVNKVMICPYSQDGYASVKNFKIQGSNDNSNWVDVYTGACANSETEQYFAFDNTDYYMYYRLYIVDTQSSSSGYCSVWNLQFYGRSLNVSSNDVGTLPPQTEPKITIGGVTYWTNKTEREFAEGSNILYLYDNGIQNVEWDNSGTYRPRKSYTSDGGAILGEENIILPTPQALNHSYAITTNNKLDLSNYNRAYVAWGYDGNPIIDVIDISSVASSYYIDLANLYYNSCGNYQLIVSSTKDLMHDNLVASTSKETSSSNIYINRVWLE